MISSLPIIPLAGVLLGGSLAWLTMAVLTRRRAARTIEAGIDGNLRLRAVTRANYLIRLHRYNDWDGL